MSILDAFKKRKEEKKILSLEDSFRNMLVNDMQKIYLESSSNAELAKEMSFALRIYKNNTILKDASEILKILDSFGEKKWWMNANPEEIAVQQLKLGKDKLIIDPMYLTGAIHCILKESYFPDELLEKWDELWEQVQKQLGEDRIKEITYTEADWQREIEDACRIDLEYYGQK